MVCYLMVCYGNLMAYCGLVASDGDPGDPMVRDNPMGFGDPVESDDPRGCYDHMECDDHVGCGDPARSDDLKVPAAPRAPKSP